MTVTVYTRPTCAPCKTVKYFLQKKGISFTEKNVEESDNGLEFSKLVDFAMVPLVVIGDHKIQGLNLALLSKALML